MDPEKQREIARKGGKAAHQKGTAHEFTADEARAAGRKGGERVSADRSHMSRIGRLGGKSSATRRATTKGEPDGGDAAHYAPTPGSEAQGLSGENPGPEVSQTPAPHMAEPQEENEENPGGM